LNDTVLGDVDLGATLGLSSCIHAGPSTIDFRTLARTSLPLAFLRGVGVPEKIIEYLPSLLSQAIQHYSCFVSYAAKDQEFAARLHGDLQAAGVRCWFAPEDLRVGAPIYDAIDESIRLHDKILLLLSEDSIKSAWVGHEVARALAEERKRGQAILFPLRLDDSVMESQEVMGG
jgi:hypothetical protein